MSYFFKNILLNFYFVLRIFVVSIGLLSGSFSYSETDYTQENIPSDVEEVKNFVVRLELKLTKALARSGTGFILEDGVLATNFHVLKGLLSENNLFNKEKFSNKINPDFLSQIEIFQEDRLLDVQITSIQALDSIHDLVLLNVKGSEIPPAIKKPKKEIDLTKEELFFVGYPSGQLKAVGQNAPIEIFESEYHVEAYISVSSFFSVNNNLPGASGSPVVNQRGELMGVLNSGSDFENKGIFSDSKHLFSLRNAEYGVQCSKNTSIKDCFQQMEDFRLKEAEKGDAYVQFKLGLFSKLFNEYKKAIKYLEMAAQQGNINAYLVLGNMYLIGEGVSQDSKKAFEYFELAAQAENQYAYYALGNMYLHGEGVSQDDKKALEYLEIAAQAENQYAYYVLGNAYLYGEAVLQDSKKAIEYFELAAQQEHADSVFELGQIYYRGEAVPQDSKKAIEYFEQAAQQGHIDSLFQLGTMYLYDEAVPQDTKKAIEYFEQAAQQGSQEAYGFLLIVNCYYIEEESKNKKKPPVLSEEFIDKFITENIKCIEEAHKETQ
ncbi:MAG: bifunctional trypsin-like peptidase domain-containing/SEL1-like repeat protein [Bdellovibrionales bacterium]